MEDRSSTQTTVAIVGGGLSGLYVGNLLHVSGVNCQVLEARDRLGGRILSAEEGGLPSDDGFDLGASWFWPKMQPQLAALVRELGLPFFAQNNEGDVIFERMSRETPCRYRAIHQEAESMRLAGGTGSLIRALAARLPSASLRLNSSVMNIARNAGGVLLTVAGLGGVRSTVAAKQVVAALPPRLLAEISFTPEIENESLRLWQQTPTWMAPHAKWVALYETPFWRGAGLSGTAQSLVGPLAEIHDATTLSGKPALLGFVGVSAGQRQLMGEAALNKECLDQLVRLYGASARTPRAVLLKDWATDSFTAAPEDCVASGHPKSSGASWVTGAWRDWLSVAGSETAASEPGYLAGAVNAAERAAAGVMGRLAAHG